MPKGSGYCQTFFSEKFRLGTSLDFSGKKTSTKVKMVAGITLEVVSVCLPALLPFTLSSLFMKTLPLAVLEKQREQDVLPYGVSGSQAWRQVSSTCILRGNSSFSPL